MNTIRAALKYVIFAMLVSSAASSAAQQARRDSLKLLRDTTTIVYLDLPFYEANALMRSEASPDTNIHMFRFFDPAVRHYIYNPTLGNIGTAVNPFYFATNPEPGFDPGMHSFDMYRMNDANARYFTTLRPFSTISYNLGMGGEQVLRLMHTQRIYHDLQLGLEYEHTNSDGFYMRQGALYHNFRFLGRFNTDNKKYKLIFNFTHNELEVWENGGLENDSTFIRNGLLTGGGFSPNTLRSTYPVALDSAQARWYNNSFLVHHAYTFDRKKKDSTDTDERPLFTLMHKLSYNNAEFRYRDGDPDTGDYNNLLYDSTLVRNSIQYQDLTNEVKAILYLRKKFRSKSPFTAGFRHQLLDVNNLVGRNQGDSLEMDSAYASNTYNNVSVFAALQFDLTEQFYFEAKGEYFPLGYNQNDVHLNFNLGYNSRDSAKIHHRLLATAAFRLTEPSYVMQVFRSNDVNWDNAFAKQQTLQFGFSYKVPEWNLGLEFNSYLINNYLYFDTMAAPQQLATVNSVFTLRLTKRFRAWRFYFDNDFLGQYSSSDAVRLPYFTGRFSFYYQGHIFKKTLYFNLGFDLTYNTPYKANAYHPITSQFHLQNETETGNYPFLDIFLSLKIKTVRAYVKLRNVNQRWPDVPYFGTPGYPLQDRSVQVGISWNFMN